MAPQIFIKFAKLLLNPKSLKEKLNIIYEAKISDIQFLWINEKSPKFTLQKRNLVQKLKDAIKNHKFILKSNNITEFILQSQAHGISPSWIDQRFCNAELRVYGKVGTVLSDRLSLLKDWQKQCGIYQLLVNCQTMHKPNHIQIQHNHNSHFHGDIKSDNIVLYQNPIEKKYLEQLRQQKRITQQKYQEMLKRISRWYFIDFGSSTQWYERMTPKMTVHMSSYYQPPEVDPLNKKFRNKDQVVLREDGTIIHAREMIDIWCLGVVIAQIILGCKIDSILNPVRFQDRAITILKAVQQKQMQTSKNSFFFLLTNMLKIDPKERKTAQQLIKLIKKQYYFYLTSNFLSNQMLVAQIRQLSLAG